MEALVEDFDGKRLNKAPAFFNMDKLTWFNTEYIRKMPFDTYLAMVTPWFDQALAGTGINYRRLAELMQDRTEVFNRVPDMGSFLAELPDYELELYTHKKMKTNNEVAQTAVNCVKPVLEGITDLT